MTPKQILSHVRKLISEHGGGDPDRWRYANRFVFARLQLDEQKTKRVVRKHLVAGNPTCHRCGERFSTRKGIHVHRLDGDRGYSLENCVLMHAECHEKHHKELPEEPGRSKRRRVQGSDDGRAVLVKRSKRYDGKPFIYWWDIAPNLAERLGQYTAVAFEAKDTGAYCSVAVHQLTRFLTEERQTSRGEGNWGIKVLEGRPSALAFEPGRRGDDWEFLRVVWLQTIE